MRLAPLSRTLVPPALCAAFVLAAIGPASALTSVPDPSPATATSTGVSIPGAAELSQRIDALRETGRVPSAVTDLIDGLLAAEGGRLSDAAALAQDASLALTSATETATATADRAARADELTDSIDAFGTAFADLIDIAGTGTADAATVTAAVRDTLARWEELSAIDVSAVPATPTTSATSTTPAAPALTTTPAFPALLATPTAPDSLSTPAVPDLSWLADLPGLETAVTAPALR